MKKEELIKVLWKYKKVSIYMGHEILLNPQDAFELAEELRSINIPIMGITGWYYIGDPKDNKIKEDLTVDYYVGDNIWFGENRIEESINLVKEYIQNRLPSYTDFISLDIDIPDWEEIYARTKGNEDMESC